MQIKKINIIEKFKLINENWKPYIVGELNGQYFKLDKFKGPFTWHHHENEDEMFLVIKGEFDMMLRNETIRIKEGEFIIIPRGVEHCPSAENEVHILLFEPKATLNTGNVKDEFTLENLLRLDE